MKQETPVVSNTEYVPIVGVCLAGGLIILNAVVGLGDLVMAGAPVTQTWQLWVSSGLALIALDGFLNQIAQADAHIDQAR